MELLLKIHGEASVVVKEILVERVQIVCVTGSAGEVTENGG